MEKYSCIQVYDPQGVYQYSIVFPTGGLGHFDWLVDKENRIHILVARTDQYIIVDHCQLVRDEVVRDADAILIENEMLTSVIKTRYDASGNEYFVKGKRVCRRSSTETDCQRIVPESPIFPLPLQAYWLIGAAGVCGILLLLGKDGFLSRFTSNGNEHF